MPGHAVGEKQRRLRTVRDATLDLAKTQELLQLCALLQCECERHGPAAAVWTIGPRRRVDHAIAVTPPRRRLPNFRQAELGRAHSGARQLIELSGTT